MRNYLDDSHLNYMRNANSKDYIKISLFKENYELIEIFEELKVDND